MPGSPAAGRVPPEPEQELGFPRWRSRYPFGKLDTALGLVRQAPLFLRLGFW